MSKDLVINDRLESGKGQFFVYEAEDGQVKIDVRLEQESYLVILADRGNYILPWTAYLVEQPHRQRKLQKEYEEYRRNRSQKG